MVLLELLKNCGRFMYYSEGGRALLALIVFGPLGLGLFFGAAVGSWSAVLAIGLLMFIGLTFTVAVLLLGFIVYSWVRVGSLETIDAIVVHEMNLEKANRAAKIDELRRTIE